MAISIGANGNRMNYGVKHYRVDTEQDLAKISRSNLAMGSTCFVIETSKYYMLNGQKKWVAIKPYGSGSGGGTNPDDDFIYDGGDAGDETPDDVIYEGGII